MKKLGKWVLLLLALEFVLAFAIGTRMRRQMEAVPLHFVAASPAPAPLA